MPSVALTSATLLAVVVVAAAQQYVSPVPPAYVRPGVAPPGYYDQSGYPDTPPKYEYAYEVAEPATGDFHSQQESRDGDVVQGVYTVVEADGTRRIVEYTADANGFNAIVRKEGQANPNYAVPNPPGYKPFYAPGGPSAPIAPIAPLRSYSAAPIAPVPAVTPAYRL